MSTVILEDWIAQYSNLKPTCELLVGKTISSGTWHNWEQLVGACYPQGRRLANRKYTDEQTELFLCLAWYRRLFPKAKLTYRGLRNYHASNQYKIAEVFQAIIEGKREEKGVKREEKLVSLAKVKQSCDAVMGRKLSRDCWARWKNHIGLPRRVKCVDEGAAALLVFIATWRHDRAREKLPSANRLLTMMGDKPAMTLDAACSSTQFRQWQMTGCKGKDLPKYLAACGFKVSPFTLYSWGNNYSQRKHYTVSELAQWRQIAASKRRINAA